jgi:hypothetical protein
VDFTVQWFVRDVGLKVLEGLLLFSEDQVTLGTIQIGLKDLFFLLTLFAL